jgi:metallophosphoesterase superfamily enzyme
MFVLHDWFLTPERVAIHWPSRIAVVADPHLGYSEARRRRGEAVPEESTTALLEPLRRVLQEHIVQRLVVAGDLLEDADCPEALAAFVRWCEQSALKEIAIVPGNHDAGLAVPLVAKSLLTFHPEGFVMDGWRIVHGEGRLPSGPLVHGHEHPWLRWSPKSRAIRPRFAARRIAPATIDGPCYLSGPERLILPAYSTEAAGVNILSMRHRRSYRCHVIGGNNVVDVGDVSTLRTRLSVAYGKKG